MTHHPHHFSEAVNRTALGIYIYVDMDIDMHVVALHFFVFSVPMQTILSDIS